MQFIDLAKQQSGIRDKIEERIKKVLDHGKYIMGPEVFELEVKLAEYIGVKHCISCSSGTDALLIALMAKGIGPGDAVITTPFTFIATAGVIKLLGATPVFVDIYPKTFNINPELISGAINFSKEIDNCFISLGFAFKAEIFDNILSISEKSKTGPSMALIEGVIPSNVFRSAMRSCARA